MMRIMVIIKTNNQSDDGFDDNTQNCKMPPDFHIYSNENVEIKVDTCLR